MIAPNKALGQNFLLNNELAEIMVRNLEIQEGETIVEIGSGTGVLTYKIVEKITQLNVEFYSIEVDPRFIGRLYEDFLDYRNVNIVEADILEWLPKFETASNLKVIGSLPFYITSPILHTIIKLKKQPEIAVLLVQKEVAEKITAKAPDANYLSVFTQTFFDTHYIGTVKRTEFTPEPQVDGAVIQLFKKTSPIAYEQINAYEDFLHRKFSQPRKMLNKVFSPGELQKYNVDGNLRPQNIEVAKWIEMFNLR